MDVLLRWQSCIFPMKFVLVFSIWNTLHSGGAPLNSIILSDSSLLFSILKFCVVIKLIAISFTFWFLHLWMYCIWIYHVKIHSCFFYRSTFCLLLHLNYGDSFLVLESDAEGDSVNCSICSQWAHLGCGRWIGLGAFKVIIPYRNGPNLPFYWQKFSPWIIVFTVSLYAHLTCMIMTYFHMELVLWHLYFFLNSYSRGYSDGNFFKNFTAVDIATDLRGYSDD